MDDLISITKTFFENIWALFSGVTIPGLGMTAAEMFIALFVIGFSLNLISLITGFRSNVGSAAESMRTSREKIGQYRKAIDQNKRNNNPMGFR